MRLGWLGRFGGLAVRLLIETIYFEVPWQPGHAWASRATRPLAAMYGKGFHRSHPHEAEKSKSPASGARHWQAIVKSLFT